MNVNDKYLEETLSAMFDGEADQIEVHRVLKELSSNSSLRDKWRRYEMTSASINKNTAEYPSAFVKAENIQLNLGSTSLRTSAEFGIPPTLARNVAISNHSQKKSIPSNKILFHSKTTDNNLTREQG